jgi:hypothetical protein
MIRAIVFLALVCFATTCPAQRPLGTFTAGPGNTADCPAGFTCNDFKVVCPGIANAKGTIADQKPTVTATRLVVLLSAGGGNIWWSAIGDPALVSPFLQSLLDNGTEIIQIKWSTPWEAAPSGVSYGQEAVGCRPATAINWLHSNYATPKFVVAGSSGGASQLGYAITSYGLAAVIDNAIFVSGPPMAAISKGCLNQSGYSYNLDNARRIDSSYGYNNGVPPGPCELHDATFADTWIANSVETGGASYLYPTTIVNFIVGGADNTGAPNHASDYFNVLSANQQPSMTWQVVPAMAHTVQSSQDGLNALLAAILQ